MNDMLHRDVYWDLYHEALIDLRVPYPHPRPPQIQHFINLVDTTFLQKKTRQPLLSPTTMEKA